MIRSKKRVQFSFVVAKTHRLLVASLCVSCVILSCLYLFLMNRVAMQGYVLTKEAEKNFKISKELGALDTRLTRFETSDYVIQKSKFHPIVLKESRRFLVMKETLTAQR